jgi:cytochrome c-type biogenesis protein
MIDNIFDILYSGLYENAWIAILASFAWGILSILLSPCHLSSIPLIIGFINSHGTISLKRTF